MVLGNFPKLQQWQHGKRRTLAPFASSLSCRTLLAIRAGKPSIDDAHRTDEAVTFSDHGLEKAWPGRFVTESGPNLSNDVVDVALGVDEEIRTPKLFDDLLARNQLLSPG